MSNYEDLIRDRLPVNHEEDISIHVKAMTGMVDHGMSESEAIMLLEDLYELIAESVRSFDLP